jgi:hypothetical protein
MATVCNKSNRCSRGVSIYLLLLCSSARFGQISMQAEILHAVTRDSEPPRLYWRTHCVLCFARDASIAGEFKPTPERKAHNKSAAAGINQSAAVLEKESVPSVGKHTPCFCGTHESQARRKSLLGRTCSTESNPQCAIALACSARALQAFASPKPFAAPCPCFGQSTSHRDADLCCGTLFPSVYCMSCL